MVVLDVNIHITRHSLLVEGKLKRAPSKPVVNFDVHTDNLIVFGLGLGSEKVNMLLLALLQSQVFFESSREVSNPPVVISFLHDP